MNIIVARIVAVLFVLGISGAALVGLLHVGLRSQATRLPVPVALPTLPPPLLAFSQLPFESQTLADCARSLHDFAERTAQADWTVQRYLEKQIVEGVVYEGRWQSGNERGRFHKNDLPYQDLSLCFQRNKQGAFVDELSVHRMSVPATGWAMVIKAKISEDKTPGCRPQLTYLYLTVGHVNGGFSFSSSYDSTVIHLGQMGVRAHQDESTTQYRFSAALPLKTAEELNAYFQSLCGSNESFREATLRDFDALRDRVRAQISTNAGIEAYDLQGVSSANPPREIPIQSRLPSVGAREALLQQSLADLAAREKVLRENYVEIHAAIQKAIPWEAFDMAALRAGSPTVSSQP